jgi:uncharacterized membrane protein
MKKILLLCVCFFVYLFLFIPFTHAQTPPSPTEHYYKATVIAIVKETVTQTDGMQTLQQTIKVHVVDGPLQGKDVVIERGDDVAVIHSQQISKGTTVIINETLSPGQQPHYSIADVFRLNYLVYIGIAFFAFTFLVAGWKGFGALCGLIISIGIIMFGIVPAILHHVDPLIACIAGALVILVTTTFIAHGFSKATAIAVSATFLSLLGTILFSLFAVHIAHMTGLGTEDSYMLNINPTQQINPKGLLLGGIIIGALGALNDITTTQVAAINALHQTNPKAAIMHLIEQGFFIGREHIISLVNTLVLAYAGSALAVFIFFALNPSNLPWWVIINNETVSEEIIRSIAGSFGLVLAIPIATILAAWLATQQKD